MSEPFCNMSEPLFVYLSWYLCMVFNICPVTFQKPETSADVLIRVADITGKPVRQEQAVLHEGNHQLKFDFRPLEKGLYYIQFQTGGRTINRNIIIQ